MVEASKRMSRALTSAFFFYIIKNSDFVRLCDKIFKFINFHHTK